MIKSLIISIMTVLLCNPAVYTPKDLVQDELSPFFYEFEREKGVKIEMILEIEIFYENDKEIESMKKYLDKVPTTMLKGTKTIVLLDYENEDVAGTAINKTIRLYNFETYDKLTQKRILYHEIGHLWAVYLTKYNIIDYSLEEYKTYVELDNNYITKYSKDNIREDFADAIAEYLINKESFSRKYKNRMKYIESILEQGGDI